MEDATPQSDQPSLEKASDADPNSTGNAPDPRPRKRRWWLRIFLGLLLLLILLVLFAPQIASTAPGRRLVLGMINKSLDGQLEIDDWSLSWTGGLSASGVTLRDPQGQPILRVSRLQTQLPLLKTLAGGFTQFNLGRTTIDELDLTHLHFDQRGQLNLVKVFQLSHDPNKPPTAIGLSGDLTIGKLTGRISAQGVDEKLHILDSAGQVVLTGLSEPMKTDLKLALAKENGDGVIAPAGTINLVGDLHLRDQNAFRMQLIRQKGAIVKLDLSVLNPLLSPAGLRVAGQVDGRLDLGISDSGQSLGEVQLTVAGARLGGAALGGVTLGGEIELAISARHGGPQTPVTLIADAASPGAMAQGQVSLIADLQAWRDGQPNPAMEKKRFEFNFVGGLQVGPSILKLQGRELSLDLGGIVKVRNKDLFVASLDRANALASGQGNLQFSADVKQLLELLGSLTGRQYAIVVADPQARNQLRVARIEGSLALLRKGSSATSFDAVFQADLDGVAAGESFKDRLAITLGGQLPDDLTQLVEARLDLKGNLITASVSNLRAILARDNGNGARTFNHPLDMIQSAEIAMNFPRLQVLQPYYGQPASPTPNAIAATAPSGPVTGDSRISGPVAPSGDAVAPAPSPIEIRSGALTLNISAQRDERGLSLPVRAELLDWRLKKGPAYFGDGKQKLDLQMSAAIPSAPQVQGGRIIRIDTAIANLGFGRLQLVRPIILNNATGGLDGAFTLQGPLEELLALIEFFKGAPAGSVYPYSGLYTITQDLKTAGDQTQFAGSLQITELKGHDPLDQRKAIFTESRLTLANDVRLDSKSKTLEIRNLDLAMEKTGALGFSLTQAKILDPSDGRRIVDSIRPRIRVDWAAALDLLRPMLGPGARQKLQELRLTGRMDRVFEISGSLPSSGPDRDGKPAPLPIRTSLRSLYVFGWFDAGELDYAGFAARDLKLPLVLEKGLLTVADMSRPKSQRYAAPFACNEGEIDLGGLALDLRHNDPDDPDAMDLWITFTEKNKQVFKSVSVNAVMARSTVGKYINPGMTDAKQTTGRLNLTIEECRDVPLSWFSRDDDVAQTRRGRSRSISVSSGRAQVRFSVDGVSVDNPIVNQLTGGSVSGDIRRGQILVTRDGVRSEIPIETNRGTLAFTGNVDLQTGLIGTFEAVIPKELLNRSVLGKIPGMGDSLRLLPAAVHVPFRGSIDKPSFDLSAAIIRSITGGKSNSPLDLIRRTIPGSKDDKSASPGDQPTPGGKERARKKDPSLEPLEGLLNDVLRPGEDRGRRPGELGDEKISGPSSRPSHR